ncbi:PAS domain S-box protein, partial [bacterium]
LEALFGLAPGSFLGSESAFFDLLHPEDRDRVERAVFQAIEGHGDYAVEFRFRHASGEWRWMEGRGRAIYDSTGRPTRLHGIGMDVTERHDAEQALRRTELRLSRLFETNLLGVLYFDIHGGVQDANDAFLRIVGYDRDDLRAGRIDWSRMTPEEFRGQDERAVDELRRLGAHAAIEKQYRRRDGTPVWVLVGSAMVEGDHGVGFVLDLTGVKAAAAALRDADRRKDEFLATLAHELRNPLAPIRSATQLLGLLPQVDPQVRRIGEIVERQVRHMARLVDDLMDVSRITLGQIHLRWERFGIRTVLQEAVEAVRPAIESARHRIDVSLPEEDFELEGDPTRISQVFHNLLNNAVKYTRPGGHIVLQAVHDGAAVRIRVRDDG